MEEPDVQPRREWTYEDIPLESLNALDLRQEAAEHPGMQAFRIIIEQHVEAAQALYDPESQRLGIAWGADATWADVDNVEQGIEMWVNQSEEWSQRN